MLFVFLAGISVGISIGWHAGFLSGLENEAAMSRERGACYCHLPCCDRHGVSARSLAIPLDSCQREER